MEDVISSEADAYFQRQHKKHGFKAERRFANPGDIIGYHLVDRGLTEVEEPLYAWNEYNDSGLRMVARLLEPENIERPIDANPSRMSSPDICQFINLQFTSYLQRHGLLDQAQALTVEEFETFFVEHVPPHLLACFLWSAWYRQHQLTRPNDEHDEQVEAEFEAVAEGFIAETDSTVFGEIRHLFEDDAEFAVDESHEANTLIDFYMEQDEKVREAVRLMVLVGEMMDRGEALTDAVKSKLKRLRKATGLALDVNLLKQRDRRTVAAD